LIVGVAEVGAIACGLIPVTGGQLAVTSAGKPARSFAAGILQVGQGLAILGAPVPLLGAQITLLRPFDQDLDPGIGLDGIHLPQQRLRVALLLVGFPVTPVGSVVSPIGPPVAAIGLPVAAIGLPVTPVRRQVPLSADLALVGGVVPLTGGPVSRIAGMLSLRSGVVAEFLSMRASLSRPLTLLNVLLAVGDILCVRVGGGLPPLLHALCGGLVPLVGQMISLASNPVTLVGDAVAFMGDPVTLVGAALALALLGVGSQRESLPSRGHSTSEKT
jgi:hypothetical protein